MGRVIAVVVFALSTNAFAGRKLLHYPMSASVGQSTGGGAYSGVFGDYSIIVRNVSETPQTVTATLTEEGLGTAMAVLNPALSGWTLDAGAWYGRATMVTGRAPLSFTISPGNSHSFVFRVSCAVAKSSVSCPAATAGGAGASSSGFQTSDSAAANYIAQWAASYTSTLTLDVAEDRGALSGMASINVGVGDGINQLPNPQKMPLNGGRPF